MIDVLDVDDHLHVRGPPLRWLLCVHAREVLAVGDVGISEDRLLAARAKIDVALFFKMVRVPALHLADLRSLSTVTWYWPFAFEPASAASSRLCRPALR